MNVSDKSVSDSKNEIKFNFRPYQFEQGNHAVEKADDGGIVRRYVQGVASGIKEDLHGEYMTKSAVQSFMDQSNAGELLLYSDIHGIKASEDIGILVKAEILKSGDWFTKYRLYDESDGVGSVKLEKIDNIWKQLKGMPPYSKPRQKGFSIEGFIPDDQILQSVQDEFGNIGQRVINDVDLDGVILVPKPAYKDSIANACCKALKVMHPRSREALKKNIQGKLRTIVDDNEIKNKYHEKKWQIQNALEETIEDVMKKNQPEKEDQLNLAFDEYKEIMISEIIQSKSIFTSEDEEGEEINELQATKSSSSKLEKMELVLTQLRLVRKMLLKKGGHNHVKKEERSES